MGSETANVEAAADVKETKAEAYSIVMHEYSAEARRIAGISVLSMVVFSCAITVSASWQLAYDSTPLVFWSNTFIVFMGLFMIATSVAALVGLILSWAYDPCTPRSRLTQEPPKEKST